jgi:DNA invertase Pin-like site-specific DNA recombinase
MIYGYARVSPEGQHLDGRLEELKAAGCSKIYREKISGARSDRLELTRLMAKVRKGDAVVVSRLDRFARSSRDLLNILHEISVKGAVFRCLHDAAWADTSTPHGRLIVTVLAVT